MVQSDGPFIRRAIRSVVLDFGRSVAGVSTGALQGRSWLSPGWVWASGFLFCGFDPSPGGVAGVGMCEVAIGPGLGAGWHRLSARPLLGCEGFPGHRQLGSPEGAFLETASSSCPFLRAGACPFRVFCCLSHERSYPLVMERVSKTTDLLRPPWQRLPGKHVAHWLGKRSWQLILGGGD